MPLPRSRSKKPPKAKEAIPCQYACGRPAAGTLSINFYAEPSDERGELYQRGFAVTIPCCRECLKASIRVAVTIPEVAAND